MTVQELIDELKKHNPNMTIEIMFSAMHDDGEREVPVLGQAPISGIFEGGKAGGGTAVVLHVET